ncbi:MAG: biotin--[acetyl-CoA-carboxylase] ligase [Peptostreptococcaceae bacterium]|nr:biotin--[acetyl-CoA-carboxylase] ligase [Peptostreptococcaceae bacterium]
MDRTILEFLKNHRLNYVSGEAISKTLGVSRTAVWKHINELKKSGYEIESLSRKGYRLVGEPDLLTKDELSIGMSTVHLGHNVVCFETIGSTNNYIKENADDLPDGTLVVSEEQNSGRGRLGREWTSPSGKGIWMSLLLKPKIAPQDAPKLTQIAAAALIETIKCLYGLDVKVKWPNDIVVGDRKVCGILTEMEAEVDCVNYIVLGIGINANIDVFSEELADKATSMKIEIGEAVDRKKLLFHFLNCLERFLDLFFEDGDFEKALNICRKHSAVIGKKIWIKEKNNSVEVLATGINDSGELVVQYEDGSEKEILSGEVSIRSENGYI